MICSVPDFAACGTMLRAWYTRPGTYSPRNGTSAPRPTRYQEGVHMGAGPRQAGYVNILLRHAEDISSTELDIATTLRCDFPY
eukprot:1719822-Rhodomonas_salina.6